MPSYRALAILCLSLAAGSAPASDEAITRANAAVEAGNLNQAATILDAAHRAAPRDAAVAHALGRIELRRGNAERAVELAEAAVRRGADVADHHVLLGNALAANIDSLGNLGKFRAARRMRAAWERALELDPDHLDARFSLFGFFAQAPGIVGGGRDKAEAQLPEIARRDVVMGHRARAMLLRIDGDHDGALREFDAAVAAVGDDNEKVASIETQRGFLCQQLERWACAHAAFIAVLAADADNMPAWYQIGRTAVFSGERVDEGIAGFRRYVEGPTPRAGEPSFAWAHTRLGTLYEKQGRTDDARAAYRAALALEPDHEAAKEALAALE